MVNIVSSDRKTHIITSDAEAVEVAQTLAEEFAKESAIRDRDRRLPHIELEKLSKSGLLGITVPKEYGGVYVSNVTLANVIKILSEGDSSLGQIPQNHLYMVEAIRLSGTEKQKRYYFQQVLEGKRLGNAFCEIGTKTATSFQTRVTRTHDGKYVLNGKKFYSTGALFAHIVPVVALDDEDHVVIVFVDRQTRGLTIIDDWSGMGQRTTASGTTLIENVLVEEWQIVRHHLAFEKQTTMGAIAQIIHTAVDVGIARASHKDTINFVRTQTRPWSDSGVDHAYEDPLILSDVGEITIKLHAAEALLERAGEFIDRALVDGTEKSAIEASIAVAEAKALADEVALFITSKQFELSGTKSTLDQFNFSRHWRNVRTHTLHDPVRWKYHAIGNYFLNGVNPPRHGAF
ncbi:SfnB family sulfur acquisition oxidoreductase [Leptolyngbya sp. FACHB-16]|uniref:SfnB family sulfur acquisition oxidoreductase n=1 Tax=unclassified Leptolyngbya TaxID=2650499 RepID=UPI0016896F84|nr:SfnB family sulfur acquisition oxidoreductase [Leptolyngbya sp. FACHB-16]MBD2153808.1 SfnB family sulfur acquisition oxidoreductase [Leptolyngbya sp. FACHB-16]